MLLRTRVIFLNYNNTTNNSCVVDRIAFSTRFDLQLLLLFFFRLFTRALYNIRVIWIVITPWASVCPLRVRFAKNNIHARRYIINSCKNILTFYSSGSQLKTYELLLNGPLSKYRTNLIMWQKRRWRRRRLR